MQAAINVLKSKLDFLQTSYETRTKVLYNQEVELEEERTALESLRVSIKEIQDAINALSC